MEKAFSLLRKFFAVMTNSFLVCSRIIFLSLYERRELYLLSSWPLFRFSYLSLRSPLSQLWFITYCLLLNLLSLCTKDCRRKKFRLNTYDLILVGNSMLNIEVSLTTFLNALSRAVRNRGSSSNAFFTKEL